MAVVRAPARVALRRARPVIDPRMPRWWDAAAFAVMAASLVLLLLHAGEVGAWAEGPRFYAADGALCFMLLVDWAARAARSQDRARFLRAHWVELIASVPLAGPLHGLHAEGLAALLRVLRVGVLVRRVTRRLHLPPLSLSLTYVALALVGTWVGVAMAFHAFEHGHNPAVRTVKDALWWGIVTLSTVGYGDLYPVTVGGRVVAGLTMAFGVGLLGTFAGMWTSILIDLQARGANGLGSYRMKRHVIVLGWNEKARAAILEVHHDPRSDDDVVIVAECDHNPMERERVAFVRGNPCRREALERAGAADAAAAIVLARDVNDPRSDYETAMAVTAVRAMAPDARVSAELVSPENREFLERAGCDAIIDAVSVASALLVRGVKDAGVPVLIEDLLLVSRGHVSLLRAPIDPAAVGRPWRELAAAQLEARRTAVGLARASGYVLNPPPELTVERGDELFVIADDEA